MARAYEVPRYGSVQECVDVLTTLMAAVSYYHPTVLAAALSVHLEIVIHALLEGGLCTREEVHVFVRELERDTLQYKGN